MGLTAVGNIKEVKPTDEKKITFTLNDIHFYKKPYVTFEGKSPRYFARGRLKVGEYGFLKDLHHDRRNRTQELSEGDVDDIRSALENLGDSPVPDLETAVASTPVTFTDAFPPISGPAHQSAPESTTVDLPLGFDPSDPVDERRKQESLRAVREGAKSFRDAMMKNWGGQCAITRTSVKVALEAAHVYRYGGVATNDERNGILLRADVHRLFDRHWISFVYQGAALVARVSTRLAGSEYARCDGERIELAKRSGACPDPKVVDYHYTLFLKAEAKR